MRHPSLITCLALTTALACGDEITSADQTGGTDSSSSESTTDTPETSGTPETTGMPETTGETETGDPPGPFCGDANLDLGEECDDGNDVEDDGCNSACKSACGIQGWIDITIDDGWFDVQAMVPRSGGRIVAVGDVEAPGAVGQLRMATLTEVGFEGAIDSAPLGPAGSVDLPQTHQVDALALTGTGDVLAIGTSTEVLVMGEAPVATHWLARFAAEDLAQLWRVDIPVADEEARPLDVAVLASGDPVITMTSRIANNDTDIAFERRSGSDGSLVWMGSHTGEFDGGWSLDAAGLVAVGAGDRLWAAGIVRVDWQTFETTVIEIDPMDGAVLWTDVPLPDPGNSQEQRVYDLSAGPDGRVAVGISVLGPASAYHYGAAFMYTERELSWSLLPADLPWDNGAPYVNPRVSIDADGEALVVGGYTHDFEIATAARPWVVGMSPEGLQLCAARVGQGTDAAITPAVGFYDGGRGALNLDTYGPGGMGPGSAGNWIGTLRGW